MQSRDRMMADPQTAKWEMFERPALESGIEYDEEVKAKMWWKYKVYNLPYLSPSCPSYSYSLALDYL